MELFWPLVIVRWLHLWSLAALFGAALFAIYGEPRGARASGEGLLLHGKASWLAAAALISGVGWVALALLDATEDLGSLVSASVWRSYLIETGFGRVWTLRLLGLLALFLCVRRWPGQQRRSAGPIAGLSAAVLASVAWLGHAVAGQGPELFAGLFGYGCHVLAAGAWLGGLLPLTLALRRARAQGNLDCLRWRLERFSRLATAAVALILASGLMSAYLRTQGFADLGDTTYGTVLIVKICLFAAVLSIAAVNRWIFLRHLRRREGFSAVQALSRSVLLEVLIGLALVALAASLGSLPPSG
jgi:copper resistance protein D